MDTAKNPLGTAKVSTLLRKFSIPAIIGMIVNALYNIVDRIYIGNASNLGTNGLAGITIGFPIMIILLSIGILFGVGGATLFSIKLGENKPKEAEKILGNSLSLLVISGFLFLVFGQIFLIPILTLFGASDAVLPYSVEYMRVIFFGAIFQVVSMGMNNFLRADGQPKLAMLTMFFGAGTNIILDPLFIYGFNWGMAGAAFATILSQLLSMIWILSYFFSHRTKHPIRITNLWPKSSYTLKIMAIGLPGFLMQVSTSILNAILNKKLLDYGGDIAVSGMGIINSVQTILLMPIFGLNQGVQPIVSFNFGAKNYGRIKETEKLAIITATIIVVVGWVVTRFFPTQLVALFNRDAELLTFGGFALQTWFWSLPVIGFQIIASSYFQSIGRSKSAMFYTLTRQVLFLIPFIYIFSSIWGIDGILYAAPLADILSFIITAIGFYFGIRSLGHAKESLAPSVDYDLTT